MKRYQIATLITIAILTITILASFLLPVPAGFRWFIFYPYIALALMTTILSIGAAVIFLQGLGGFTDKLKRAYIFMCIGLALYGVAQLQLPILFATGQLESQWKNEGIIVIPFVVALTALYIGTRAFTRLFGIKNITTAIWFWLVMPVVLGVAFAFVPHAPTATPELQYDGANGFSIYTTFTIMIATAFIFQIKRVASVIYQNALAWLLLSFATMSGVGVLYLTATTVFGDDNTHIISLIVFLSLSTASVLLMRAAVAFNHVTASDDVQARSVARDFFGRALHAREDNATITSVDIVLHAVNLVSNPHAIDPVLNQLRAITAWLKPNQKLSDKDETKLMGIYLDIEQYLTTQEPIRKFTKDQLRQTIANNLRLTQDFSQTFWGKLT